MHRNKIIELLKKYHCTYINQATFKEKTLDFIQTHPDCFERSLKIGHITGSAWVVNEDGTKALLLLHKKLNLWVQPGGHADGDNDILRVSMKEAKEESGLDDLEPISSEIFDIDIHEIPENPKTPKHLHYDIRFLLKTSNGLLAKKNNESKDLLWINQDPNSLPTKELSVTRMFEKWIQYFEIH